MRVFHFNFGIFKYFDNGTETKGLDKISLTQTFVLFLKKNCKY
jgi:hypothetical protein